MTRVAFAVTRALGWPAIVRLGLVQSAIGALVMVATSLLNRVMVVEYALPAAVPAGLVAWHYAVQLSRPVWGHGSDRGGRRSPWIILGIAVLGLGTVAAVAALPLLGAHRAVGAVVSIAAFAAIGAGVGAAGTSLLALLATAVAPERRAAAAAITWIMMVAGIAVTAGVAGALVDPYSPARLLRVAGGVAAIAWLVTVVALWGVERGVAPPPMPSRATPSFAKALRGVLSDRAARRFTLFVFVSMLAYSMQDMILEPFAGLLFGFTPGQSTQLSGVQHGGVLAGMILAGIGGSAFGGRDAAVLRRWVAGGCVASAGALAGLAFAAHSGGGWPLALNIAALGFANGIFAVAAIGMMMALAGDGEEGAAAGMRMGVWGAAQAIAFGAGGLTGAVAVDALRRLTGATGASFALVFAGEAALFIVAAVMAAGGVPRRVAGGGVPMVEGLA